ncbi:hypothetical protein ACWELB_17625 [Streptomyces asiaticus]|uniref:hypothetical protein n=1 Tax=Streptomyces asiaticus TaxID=114695 RepID=UPI003D70FFA7
MAEMQRTVEVPADHGTPPGTRDGLGLNWTLLSCGGGYWGPGGNGFGYMAWPASDGRSAITVSLHNRPGDEDTAVRQIRAVADLVDHVLCSSREEGTP